MKNRIAIFASGSGSNAEEIVKHFAGHLDVEVCGVLTNNPNAFVIERAAKLGIPSLVFTRPDFTQSGSVLSWLKQHEITHVVLAGFLWLIPDYLIGAYPDKIINIHPALLPAFGGKGMFGMKVHEAVKAAGVKETGITIHLVNEHYDEGRILFQGKCVVDEIHSPEDISKAVHALEYKFYPQVIEKWILNKLN